MNPMKILVVDDEQVICSGCSLILGGLGHAVESRMTCLGGIEAVEKSNYDLVLLDLKLPDQDGFELLKKVNRKGAERIIVMSGYATVQSAVKSMKLGAVDFLQKPFTEDELLAAIENAAGRSR